MNKESLRPRLLSPFNGELYVTEYIKCDQSIYCMGREGVVGGGALLHSIVGLGFEFAFVQDDGTE